MTSIQEQVKIGPDPSVLDALELGGSIGKPLYAQVAEFLGQLAEREFVNDQLFFTEKVLFEHLPVSQVTIKRAMLELTKKGIFQRTRRKGTTVIHRSVSQSKLPPVPSENINANDVHLPQLPGRHQIRTIGIFRPAHMLETSEHGRAVMEEFRLQCSSAGLACRFYDTTDAEAVLRSFQQITSTPNEEGFVLHTTVDATVMLYHSLANRGFQSVAMEGAPESYPGWIVETDAAEAARIAVRHLTLLGHRRIVLLVNEPAIEPTVIDKVEGFKEAVTTAGISSECRIVNCDTTYGDSYDAAYSHMGEAIHGASNRPTAVMTVSDPGAWAALKWCSQNNLKVPSDISIIGFEDAKSSKYMIPSLTSIAHPRRELVSTILEVICGGMSGSSRRILIPPILMARESTGQAPARGGRTRSKSRSARPVSSNARSIVTVA